MTSSEIPTVWTDWFEDEPLDVVLNAWGNGEHGTTVGSKQLTSSEMETIHRAMGGLVSHESDALAALEGVVEVGNGDVPEAFQAWVAERIASRPSPAPPEDRLSRVEAKLDEILSLLQGGASGAVAHSQE